MTASIDTKMHPTKCNAPKSLFGLRSHACDMLVYGSLCKALSNLGHNKFLQQEAQSHSPERFDNKSIYEVCNSLMDFEMYCPPGHQACEVQQQLIEKTSGLLEGLITLYDADLFERTIGV